MYRYYFKGLRMRCARLPKWNSRLINATGDGYTEVRRYSRAKPIFILSLHAVKRMLSSRKKIEDIRFPRINFASTSAFRRRIKPIVNSMELDKRKKKRYLDMIFMSSVMCISELQLSYFIARSYRYIIFYWNNNGNGSLLKRLFYVRQYRNSFISVT